MQGFVEIIAVCVFVLGIVNMLRLSLFLLGADMYDLKKYAGARNQFKAVNRRVTIIIPAYNEELCIVRTVESVVNNDYRYKQIVVVDDGSTDDTFRLITKYKKDNKISHLTVVRQENGGKAVAINNALINHTKGSSLVMVLDADSILARDAITNMVRYFDDPAVMAAAANVKLINSDSFITMAQRFEYLISHRTKRALTVYNIEYIIGGIGSTFRKKQVIDAGYLDTDTMTEDIDFTMKLLQRNGNKNKRIIFASDAMVFTEGVIKLNSLIKQRFRWKYGRMQTLMKNRRIFFSRDKKHTKLLSWLYLPFIVFSEIILLLDPIFILFVLYISVFFAGLAGFLSVYLTVTFFSFMAIMSEDTEPMKNRIALLKFMPFAYLFVLLMSFVDFASLVKSLKKFPELFSGNYQDAHWQHVERVGAVVKPSN